MEISSGLAYMAAAPLDAGNGWRQEIGGEPASPALDTPASRPLEILLSPSIKSSLTQPELRLKSQRQLRLRPGRPDHSGALLLQGPALIVQLRPLELILVFLPTHLHLPSDQYHSARRSRVCEYFGHSSSQSEWNALRSGKPSGCGEGAEPSATMSRTPCWREVSGAHAF